MSPQSHAAALEAMQNAPELDVLIIGAGVVGAGAQIRGAMCSKDTRASRPGHDNRGTRCLAADGARSTHPGRGETTRRRNCASSCAGRRRTDYPEDPSECLIRPNVRRACRPLTDDAIAYAMARASQRHLAARIALGALSGLRCMEIAINRMESDIAVR